TLQLSRMKARNGSLASSASAAGMANIHSRIAPSHRLMHHSPCQSRIGPPSHIRRNEFAEAHPAESKRETMSQFSPTSEPFTLARDCAAILVPQGDEVMLPAGQIGYITQALGGSFTVYVEGNLFRIAGLDADALGKPPPAPIALPEDAGDEDVERVVWQQLRTCFDPEIPINVVDLALVFRARFQADVVHQPEVHHVDRNLGLVYDVSLE